MTRFAKKIDRAQPAIIDALRRAGCNVVDLSWCGRGVPDAVAVNPRGQIHFLEIKNPKPANSKAKDDRTDAELRFATLVPVAVVRTPEEALRAVGVSQ